MTDATRGQGAVRLVRRFGRLSSGRRLLLCEAVLWLAAARLALSVIPFARIATWFGALHTPAEVDRCARGSATPEEDACAREVGWAVARAARFGPIHAVCLPQAIAAKAMLNRRGIANVMHFGVARHAAEPMKAHAWLDAAGIEVTGFPIEPDMVEVACFV